MLSFAHIAVTRTNFYLYVGSIGVLQFYFIRLPLYNVRHFVLVSTSWPSEAGWPIFASIDWVINGSGNYSLPNWHLTEPRPRSCMMHYTRHQHCMAINFRSGTGMCELLSGIGDCHIWPSDSVYERSATVWYMWLLLNVQNMNGNVSIT